MANILATYSVGNSLMTYLTNVYPDSLRTKFPFEFRVVSSGELAEGPDLRNTVSLFLFRVTMNEFLRTTVRPIDPSDTDPPLSIDLHFLLTVWADNAPAEHTVLSWAMRELQTHPVLDSSSLSMDAGWSAGDIVHVIPAELSSEELMRIWDLLQPKYRLSVSYIARVVRITDGARPGGRPMVASRFSYTDQEVSG
jgi:uncharacterized protein DUF4255